MDPNRFLVIYLHAIIIDLIPGQWICTVSGLLCCLRFRFPFVFFYTLSTTQSWEIVKGPNHALMDNGGRYVYMYISTCKFICSNLVMIVRLNLPPDTAGRSWGHTLSALYVKKEIPSSIGYIAISSGAVHGTFSFNFDPLLKVAAITRAYSLTVACTAWWGIRRENWMDEYVNIRMYALRRLLDTAHAPTFVYIWRRDHPNLQHIETHIYTCDDIYY